MTEIIINEIGRKWMPLLPRGIRENDIFIKEIERKRVTSLPREKKGKRLLPLLGKPREKSTLLSEKLRDQDQCYYQEKRTN